MTVSRFATGQWAAPALFLALASAMPATAQLLDNSRIPSGSPLDSSQGQNSGANQTQGTQRSGGGSGSSQNVFTDQSAVQPFAVPRESSLLTEQQLLSARERDRQYRDEQTLPKQPPKPGEFERYVERVLGRRLPRFGEELILPSNRDFAAPTVATVPPDYIVQPGDVIVIAMTGSIEGSVEREVDTNGRIFLPGVGSITLAGVRHADLRDRVSAAIGRQFRGYTVSVAVRRLRGIRVYVTGLANNPGAFTVNSLSTLANAVFQAGGPAAGGSFRSIKLYRAGQQVADFDLYELVRGGSRVNDVVLQNEDVLFIPPAGDQVAVFGSVNEEAIYEAKPGETIAETLNSAGGPNALADRSRVIVYHTGDTSRVGPIQLTTAEAATQATRRGDLIQVLSAGSLAMPIERQSVLVRVEGEVARPGIYYLAPNTPLESVIAQAGGLTSTAYVYGTRFTRQSVKIAQQESYREAVRQLELALAAAPLSNEVGLTDADRARQQASGRELIERLREVEPDGRVVLELPPTATALTTNVLLENNDALFIPPRATTVGVFGAVYRPASFLVGGAGKALRVRDFVEKAGGATRAAERRQTFVVRANGEVVSPRRGALGTRVLPGDVVFVPVKTGGASFWQKFKDITQSLFQLGLSAATVAAVTD